MVDQVGDCVKHELNRGICELDETFGKILRGKISDLLDVSPSDAGANSKITKTNTGYLGVLEIISSQGRFVAETAGHDLETLVKSLFGLIHHQMNNWRSLRFLES
jgi:hypothetical protein